MGVINVGLILLSKWQLAHPNLAYMCRHITNGHYIMLYLRIPINFIIEILLIIIAVNLHTNTYKM